MTRDLPVSFCPVCNYKLDAATPADDPDAVPEPGCVSVCIHCVSVHVFGDDLRLRPPTAEELDRLRTDPEIRAAVSRAVANVVRLKALRRNP